MYRVLSIARYIIQRCNSQNRTISNLKLQKILYFVQAEFLVAKKQPCFGAEIEAWDFGPVVPEVYQEYKVFGSANIPVIGSVESPVILANEDRSLVDGIVDECSKYSATALVDITHNQTPWIDAYNAPGYNNIISTESIYKYFAEE